MSNKIGSLSFEAQYFQNTNEGSNKDYDVVLVSNQDSDRGFVINRFGPIGKPGVTGFYSIRPAWAARKEFNSICKARIRRNYHHYSAVDRSPLAAESILEASVAIIKATSARGIDSLKLESVLRELTGIDSLKPQDNDESEPLDLSGRPKFIVEDTLVLTKDTNIAWGTW